MNHKETNNFDTTSREVTDFTLGIQRRHKSNTRKQVSDESESFDMSNAIAELKSRPVKQLGEIRNFPNRNEVSRNHLETDSGSINPFDIKVEPSMEIPPKNAIEISASPSPLPQKKSKPDLQQDTNLSQLTIKKKSKRPGHEGQKSPISHKPKSVQREPILKQSILSNESESSTSQSGVYVESTESSKFMVKMRARDTPSPLTKTKAELARERLHSAKQHLLGQITEGSLIKKSAGKISGKRRNIESESTNNATESSEPHLRFDHSEENSELPGRPKKKNFASDSIEEADTEGSSVAQNEKTVVRVRKSAKSGSGKSPGIKKSRQQLSKSSKQKSLRVSKNPVQSRVGKKAVVQEESSSLVETRSSKKKKSKSKGEAAHLGKRKESVPTEKRSDKSALSRLNKSVSKMRKLKSSMQDKSRVSSQVVMVLPPKKRKEIRISKRKNSVVEVDRRKSKSREREGREKSRHRSRDGHERRHGGTAAREEGRGHGSVRRNSTSLKRIPSPMQSGRFQPAERRDRSASVVGKSGRKSKVVEEHSEPARLKQPTKESRQEEGREGSRHGSRGKGRRRSGSVRSASASPLNRNSYGETEERQRLFGIFEKASTQELKAMVQLYAVATKVTKRAKQH